LIDMVQICNHTLSLDEARAVCVSTILGEFSSFCLSSFWQKKTLYDLRKLT